MSAPILRPWFGALLLVLMVLTAGVGQQFKPKPQDARDPARPPAIVLETAIPQQFGDWKVVSNGTGIVTNPELQDIINRLYSQVLARTYVNSAGYHVMLSIVYGEDQRGGLQAHQPEVCYPAQGFKVLSNELADIRTPFGNIAGRRLVTRQGSRHEPVTYWFSVNARPLTGWLERRLEVVRLVLTGQVPDGVLFRVSSLDPDPQRALRIQEGFVADMLPKLSDAARNRVSGL